MASGPPPASTAVAMAAATGAPGSAPDRSPTSWTTVAPYSPSVPATEAVSSPQATASTVPARDRAWEISSRLAVMGLPSATSASTQILSIAIGSCAPTRSLQDLQLLEELDDSVGAVAFIDHDLTGLPAVRRRAVKE